MCALVSDEYKALLERKNREKPWLGTQGRYAAEVAERVWPGDRVLDFGCARQDLARVLAGMCEGVEVVGYDPGQPGLDVLPDGPFQVGVATDVMEHVEPAFLSATMQALADRCERLFLVIATIPAYDVLANGQDHHLIVRPRDWWEVRIRQELPGWTYEFLWETGACFGCWVHRPPSKTG